jgi:hypothetical protein
MCRCLVKWLKEKSLNLFSYRTSNPAKVPGAGADAGEMRFGQLAMWGVSIASSDIFLLKQMGAIARICQQDWQLDGSAGMQPGSEAKHTGGWPWKS